MKHVLRKLLNEQVQDHRRDIFIKFLLRKAKTTNFRPGDDAIVNKWVQSAATGTGYKSFDKEKSSLAALILSYKKDKPVFYYRVMVEANNMFEEEVGQFRSEAYKLQYFVFAMFTQYTEAELLIYFKSLNDFYRDSRCWLVAEYLPHGEPTSGFKDREIQSLQVSEKKMFD
jgi:hypothetical protein